MDHEQRDRLAREALRGYANGPDATLAAIEVARARAATARAIVVVEGVSDQIAVETSASRLGRDLESERTVVLPIGGAHAIGRELVRIRDELGDADVTLAGLCDVAELPEFRRGLEQAGIVPAGSDVDLEHLGFFACSHDLEAELIRAAGPDVIEHVLREQGDLPAFRTLQRQPAWRVHAFDDQMHRWLRAGARRNLRYARLLVETIELDRMPRPLTEVLRAVGPGSTTRRTTADEAR